MALPPLTQGKSGGTMSNSVFTSRFQQPQKKQGYLKSFLSGFGSGSSAVINEKPKANLAYGSKDLQAGGAVYGDTFRDLLSRVSVAQDELFKKQEKDWGAIVRAEAGVGLGMINLFFAPISASLKALETHPVLGYPATTVNAIFAGIGQGSANMGLRALNESDLSQETKDKWSPLVSETSSLVGMIVAGKAGHSTYTRLTKNTNTLLNGIKEDPAFNVSIKSQTPGTRNIELNRFYDETNLPVIDFGAGKAPKSNIPTIQIGEGTPSSGIPKIPGLKYESTTTPLSRARFNPVKEQQGGERFQSQTGLKTAEQAGLSRDTVPFQNRRPQQIENADAFVAADRSFAEASLSSQSKIPKGIYPEEVYKALEKVAKETGDFELSTRLAKMNIGTEAGRRIQALNRQSSSPTGVDYIDSYKDIQASRIAKVEKLNNIDVEKVKVKTIKEAGEIKSPSIKSWEEFINKLEC